MRAWQLKVLHELDYAVAGVDDPVCEDHCVFAGHVLGLDLVRGFGVVVHCPREGLVHAASDRVAAAHERYDERLVFVDEVMTLRDFVFDGGEVEGFDADGPRNVLRGEIPPGIFVGLLEGQTVDADVARARS